MSLTHRAMVESIANALDVPVPTVIVYARTLRDADLLSKAGRGRGAAKMTSMDFARVVIAMLATDSPARSVEAVQDFGGLISIEERCSDEDLRLCHILGEKFGINHTFEEVVASLIEVAATEKFEESFRDFMFVPDERIGPFFPHFSVSVRETRVSSEVRVHNNTIFYGVVSSDEQGQRKIQLAEYSLKMERWHKAIRTTREILLGDFIKISGSFLGVIPINST